MRALVLADRAPYAPIRELAGEADVVLCLGDLGFAELQGLEDVSLPKLGVHGNHCLDYFRDLGIEDCHRRVLRLGGLLFGGMEGSHRYKPGPYQYTQAEAAWMLARMPQVDVLLCHSPPYGVNDHPDSLSHQGFLGLVRYLEEKPPQLLLHGHTYPLEGELVPRVGETEIVYVHGYAYVELPERSACS